MSRYNIELVHNGNVRVVWDDTNVFESPAGARTGSLVHVAVVHQPVAPQAGIHMYVLHCLGRGVFGFTSL